MIVKNIVVSMFLLALFVGAVFGIIASFKSNNDNDEEEHVSLQRKTVSQFCSSTIFRDTCINTLNAANTDDPKELVKASILSAQVDMQKLFNLSDSLIEEANRKDNSSKTDLEDCKELLQFAIDDLQASVSMVGDNPLYTVLNRTDDIMTWLNAVVTYKQTCIDGFEGEDNPFKETIKYDAIYPTNLTSNALSIVSGLSRTVEALNITLQPVNDSQPVKSRRLLEVGNDGYPSWFSAADRKLLAQNEWKPNAVVAKDGSGQYKTIQAALDDYPNDLEGRYVIHIKAGIYKENITISKHQKHVFMYGDGMTKTIVTGNKNFKYNGYNTMKTATFSAAGEGFMAMHMGFSNTAGPNGDQAVALHVQADRAAIFDCRMDGHQNTLYAHAYRQFYRNCVISGTIDFIFGDATAIIQNSWIIVRRPKAKQVNTVTSQARDLGSQTTSLVLQNCTVVPDEKLWPDRWKIPTYLGRPWREHATTVFLENTFADFIQPEGYLALDHEDFSNKSCNYFEYNNRGPGNWTDKRVPWPGVKLITKEEAQRFTVSENIQGDKWLNDTGIPYNLGLAS